LTLLQLSYQNRRQLGVIRFSLLLCFQSRAVRAIIFSTLRRVIPVND
jgi:hypothetical protein